MKEIACPACDSKSFSWEVAQIQYGSIQYKPESDTVFTEALSNGPITGDPKTVYCERCGESYDPDDLIDDV